MTKQTKTSKTSAKTSIDFSTLSAADLLEVIKNAETERVREAAATELKARKHLQPKAAAPKAPKAPSSTDKAAAPAAKAPKAPKAAAPAVEAPSTGKAGKAPKAKKRESRLQLAVRLEAEAAKAPKAQPKASEPKARKAAQSDSAVHSEEMAAACEGKAPKGDSLQARALQHLAALAQEHSEAYVASLRRPIGEFLDWCREERILSFAQVDTKALLAYRKSAQRTRDGEERATSTLRMSLARVKTFLSVQPEGAVRADLSVLRVQLTDAEREAQADEAAAASA
jgi:hypothetical protein